jgi:cytochrome c peroxidase
VDQGPGGGRTWDGRAQSVHDQARLPLFSPFEMANRDEAAVVTRLARTAAAPRFRETFGEHILGRPALAFEALLLALETYQQEPREFYPYTSKYDAWLRHQAALSPAELRGLAAFNDPARGNCARCHPGAMRRGAFPQFTDFGYAALGVPRNPRLPANADPGFYDLGLCGPLRTDLTGRAEYCGLFRTPTLRNVATRKVFFHNGTMHRLEDVVRFYATRDSSSASWYPRAADGATHAFDDLPDGYRRNLERGAPFDRQVGDAPALNDRDVEDVVAFLETLTDGYASGTAAGTP